MKIKKGNHEYKGMFWQWILWQADCISQYRDLFGETLTYLLPYKSKVIVSFPDYYFNEDEWKIIYGHIIKEKLWKQE